MNPTKKILVVDDDPVIRKMVSVLLTQAGHQIETANNGVEGLTAFRKFNPDVIISDVLMPEMDGYEFCSLIRELPGGRQIPLLMLTSLDSVEQKIKGFDVGADEYIVKPFEPREFLARIAILVKRSEINQEIQIARNISAKTIAVFSLRGGAGVSTIATNISIGLSQIWDKPTTLVDMVMTGGQSALFMNLPLKNTWAEIAKFPIEEFDEHLIQIALLEHESGVYALASPRHPEKAEIVSPEKVRGVLSILNGSNEYIVLDMPHNFSATTLAALDTANVILLIVQPEIISIRSAVMVLETFNRLGYDLNQVSIVLNWTFPRQGIANDVIEKVLHKKISLVLPYASEELLHGLNYGQPPAFSTPEEPLGMLFEDISMALSKEEHLTKKPEQPTEAWKRVIERAKLKETR